MFDDFLSSWVEQVPEAMDKVFCSRTQHSDPGESLPSNHSTPILTLYQLIQMAPLAQIIF